MREAHDGKREISPRRVAGVVLVSALGASIGVAGYGIVHDYNNTIGAANELSGGDHVAPRVAYEEGCTVELPFADQLIYGAADVHNPVDLGPGRGWGSHKYGFFIFDGEKAAMHEFTTGSFTHLQPDGTTPGGCRETSGPLGEMYVQEADGATRTYFALPGERTGDAAHLVHPPSGLSEADQQAELQQQEQALINQAVGMPTHQQ